MTAASVDLLVAYTQYQPTPVVIIGLSTPPAQTDGSVSPFSDIVKDTASLGFYSSNIAGEKHFADRKPWQRWSVETREALIRAIDDCWAELTQAHSRGNDGPTLAKLSTASAKAIVPSVLPSEHPNGSFSSLIGLWRVDIMATSFDAPSRLQSLSVKRDDWVMVLTGEDDGAPVHDLSPDSSSSVTAVERPLLSPLNSTSTVHSVLTDSVPSPGTSGSRRIEIQAGVPAPLRAASELARRPLPPDNTVGIKTVWTPTRTSSTHEDIAVPVQEDASDAEKTGIRDLPYLHQLNDGVSTLWNASGVAPVNSQDLANLAQDSSVGMVLATPELRVYWVNKRWYEITQIEPEQDLNTWIDNIHPDYLPVVMDLLQELMSAKVKRTGDIKWKNGNWFSFTAQVLTDAQGNVSAVAATIDDCTQRKKLELAQMENLKNEEIAARRRAEEASARTKELVELQSQREELERRTKEFAQMAEISSIALTCATADGELIWGKSGFVLDLHGKLTFALRLSTLANKAFVSDDPFCS